MSDYEKINAGVKLSVSGRRKEAIKRVICSLASALAALAALVGLEAIGFISKTFLVILLVITVCAGAFKTGYIWRDIKF